MPRGVGYIIFFGFIVWLFLMWDYTTDKHVTVGNIDDATVSDRCAEFKQDFGDGEWSLGYAGRVRQLVRGCF